MYCPQSFAVTDLDVLHDFIESHSFGTLVSIGASVPTASHLPLLLDRTRGPAGTLIGHLAAANPQAARADGKVVLAIFQGPDAYISPTWYEEENVVPTWNYVAVHATGILKRIIDPSRKLEIVRRYVAFYEADLPNPWSLDSADPAFIEKLLTAIDGFEIEIDRLEGKWKLNQNHPPARRERVIRALNEAGGEDRTQIADLMTEMLTTNR